MTLRWLPSNGVHGRLFNAALAALLAFTVVVVVPGAIPAADATTNHEFQYVIVFQNGTTVSGTTNEGTGNAALVPNVGGTNNPSTEAGMLVHMSCSDNFNLDKDPGDSSYGYSASGAQPELGVDTAWRIADYAFRRVGTNGGQCGDSDLFESGRIVVEKQTVPDADPTGFVFAGDAAGTISDGQTIVVSDLDAGIYTSTETVPTGWDLTSIVCDEGASGDIGTQTATFTITAGETLTCVFTNTKQPPPLVPDIDIEKATNGFDADTPSGPSILVGGLVTWTYVVTNVGDVDLTDIVVTDDNGTPGDTLDDVTVTCPASSLIVGAET